MLERSHILATITTKKEKEGKEQKQERKATLEKATLEARFIRHKTIYLPFLFGRVLQTTSK